MIEKTTKRKNHKSSFPPLCCSINFHNFDQQYPEEDLKVKLLTFSLERLANL
jgi:hypothetical protein